MLLWWRIHSVTGERLHRSHRNTVSEGVVSLVCRLRKQKGSSTCPASPLNRPNSAGRNSTPRCFFLLALLCSEDKQKKTLTHLSVVSGLLTASRIQVSVQVKFRWWEMCCKLETQISTISYSHVVSYLSLFHVMMLFFSALTASHPLVVTIFIAAESFTDMNKWVFDPLSDTRKVCLDKKCRFYYSNIYYLPLCNVQIIKTVVG